MVVFAPMMRPTSQRLPVPTLLSIVGMVVSSVGAQPPPAFFEAANAAAKQVLVMLECKDDNPGCSAWASTGECGKNPGFMHGTCRKACGRCDLQAEDAQHALETIAYSVRNLHADCSGDRPLMPQCDGSSERLSALLAIMQERTMGKGLQRFIEALAHEVVASSNKPATAPFTPIAPTAAQTSASVGQPAASASPIVTLSDGGRMPSVGLGTWLTVGDECYRMVSAGLRAGFRHIDTSENYANHDEIGTASPARTHHTSRPPPDAHAHAQPACRPHARRSGALRKRRAPQGPLPCRQAEFRAVVLRRGRP